ncbi:tRNA (guanosine(37)-N1)-methyltransferase TrmD [Patescibacteria group bacterium]|nr:tRNA (guanosine(37)-N1)-methyltransferase TrmD [Patescibacteria group bacterium]MBU4481531.1 tRNA (guanosine(37)-N1)-methyltransferase TrmD [Patescibacteria group bacterium]
MRFDIITIFPKIFDSYLKETFIKKAQKNGLISIYIHDLRKWAKDKHKTVDDRPYGGGLGMVIKVEPVFRAVSTLKLKVKSEKLKVILFTPRGEKFNQKVAYQFSKLDRLIMICGRYEGVDDRVAKYIADKELSIGDYDLMGGDLPAMVVIETVARLIPGVLGKPQLLKERITKEKGFIEYPQYTRPEVFEPNKYIKNWRACPPKFRKAKFWRVPKVLLSGHHQKIEEWRKKHRKVIEK